MKKIVTLMIGALALSGGLSANQAQAAVVYKVNYDQGPSSPSPAVYTASGSEILPTGITGTRLANANLIDPSVLGPQGGQVQSFTVGGAWPNSQGYRFGGDGTQFTDPAGPVISNNYTLEFFVNPSYNGNSGSGTLTAISTIFDSGNLGDGTNKGDTRLSVDQNTGILTFDPRAGSGFGAISSSFALQAGTWYHIAAVVRGTGNGATQQTELWIDGALDGTGSYPLTWELSGEFRIPGYFNVGSAYWPVNARNWQGEIDAFAVSDTALSSGSFALIPLIPEPASLMLLGVGGGLMLIRRRQQA